MIRVFEKPSRFFVGKMWFANAKDQPTLFTPDRDVDCSSIKQGPVCYEHE
jgi:hypothetical protein